VTGEPTEQPDTKRFLVWASLFMVVTVLFGQQTAFWRVDVELNMGGRYMLAALPAIALLLNIGISRLGKTIRMPALGIWIALLLWVNVIAIQQIVFVLNPMYHAGWKIFDLL
jgi:hypothetical protein